jgi:multimeric flavodoxin WrbA
VKPQTGEGVEAAHDVQDSPKSGIRVVGICGSLRAIGNTKTARSIALRGASEFGASTSLLELRDYELHFYGKAGPESDPPDVARLRGEIREAHGIIIGSPEYHGSLSGALKNMFDLMSIEDFEGKIVGLVGVAGGHIGAINTLPVPASSGTVAAWRSRIAGQHRTPMHRGGSLPRRCASCPHR